tara:strand:- start:17047 stop:17811 length:765 start_codon:yes stop_codon:yes gene_type:complete
MRYSLHTYSLSLLLFVLFLGCDSDKGLNCFQATGDLVLEEFTVPPFSRITVFERTQLIVQQGPEQRVMVETGENLLNDIELNVANGQLSIINNNGCNLVRDYGVTRVFVTAPNITEIRNSSGLMVEGRGTLAFPTLTLLSEDGAEEDEFHIDGDFQMRLDVDELNVVANGLSNFFLSGSATVANFRLYAGDCRVEARDLVIDYINLFHRSSQDMIVNPRRSIVGDIVSVGDVISVNRPPQVDVRQPYRGRLIFE